MSDSESFHSSNNSSQLGYMVVTTSGHRQDTGVVLFQHPWPFPHTAEASHGHNPGAAATSDQHKGNWVTPGEPEVWIWSNAPDPMGNCRFAERTKFEIQKSEVGRKAEEMIKITTLCCIITEGVWAILCCICSWTAATATHSHCTNPQLCTPLSASNMWWY